MKQDFQTMSEDELLDSLKTCSEGLTEKEASLRIERYGINELPKKRKIVLLRSFLCSLLIL